MTQIESFEKLPKYRIEVESIYKELGESFNKHATLTNLARHVEKNDRVFVKDIIKVFFRLGLLRKHRNDTFAWTNIGLEYAKRFLRSP
ncbi:MAG: hypothetical protein Q7S21_04005 [archaeon]|nr:hypothetical protein [archaeon]